MARNPKKKKCKGTYKDEEGNEKPCGSWAMSNGYCRIHGGVKKQKKYVGQTRLPAIKRELKKLYSGIPLQGETFEHRLEVIKNNKELMDMEADVALADLLVKLTLEYLEDNEFRGKEKLKLVETVSKLVDTLSKTKERVNKAESDYFDKHTMRYIIVQITELLKNFRLELVVEVGKDHKLVTSLDKALVGVLNVKIPMVSR